MLCRIITSVLLIASLSACSIKAEMVLMEKWSTPQVQNELTKITKEVVVK